jgi:Pyrimidine dimer DNA glycosylase
MQTFLPYPDFVACARVLDSRRLGKQRVEALQILRALLVPDYG